MKYRFKLLRQTSSEEDNHGNGYFGPWEANWNSPNVSTMYILFYILDPNGTPHMESITNMGNHLVKNRSRATSSTRTVPKHTQDSRHVANSKRLSQETI